MEDERKKEEKREKREERREKREERRESRAHHVISFFFISFFIHHRVRTTERWSKLHLWASVRTLSTDGVTYRIRGIYQYNCLIHE
jgi:hypothetical protein